MKLHTALLAAGTIILVAAGLVWAITDHQSVLLMMSGVFLLLTGALQGAQTPLNRRDDE